MSLFSKLLGFELFPLISLDPPRYQKPPREPDVLPLAPSRRFSLAVAAGAALKAGLGLNRDELTLALAEWRSLEEDATVRGALDRALASPVRFIPAVELDPVLNAERN